VETSVVDRKYTVLVGDVYACSVYGGGVLHGVPVGLLGSQLRLSAVQSQAEAAARVHLSEVRRKVSVPHDRQLSPPHRKRTSVARLDMRNLSVSLSVSLSISVLRTCC